MQAVQKICTDCGLDLNGQKRVKDPRGNYFCRECWDNRVKAAKRPKAAPAPEPEPALGLGPQSEPESEPDPEMGFDPDAFDLVEEPVAASTRPQIVAPPMAAVAKQTGTAAKTENELLKKIGYAAAGVLGLVLFDIWPLIQINNGKQQIWLSFKGIFIGWIMLGIGMVLLLPQRIGVTWKRTKGQPVPIHERIILIGVVVFGFAMTGLELWYIHSQGYTFGL